MTGKIILLRGPSAVGKSTVAVLLRERLSPAIRIDVDSLRYLTSPRLVNSEHLQLAELGAINLVLHYARKGFTAICDSVYQEPETIALISEQASQHRIPIKIFTLQADTETILQRNMNRDSFGRSKNERVIALTQEFNWNLGQVIPTGKRLPEEVADVITSHLASISQESIPEFPPRIIFVRHGQAASNQQYYPNHDEMSLSSKGKAQVKKLAYEFIDIPIAQIITSPFPRAIETAAAIAKETGVKVCEDQRWKERVFKGMYGLNWEHISLKYGVNVAQKLRQNSDLVEIEGEESLESARTRIVEALADIELLNGSATVVVSHGGPHSWLCSYLLGISSTKLRYFYLGKARISSFRFNVSGEFQRLEMLNSSSPLILYAGMDAKF